MRVEIPVAPVFEPALRPSRYKGIFGGRGSAKSWFVAGECVEWLLCGLHVLCVREIQNSIADSVKKLIEARIAEFSLHDYFDITDKEIRCPMSGGLAVFKGMQNHTAASVKSLEGFDRAWWEEASTASQHSLDLLIPTIRKGGSEVWFTWNPDSADDPVDVFMRRDTPDTAILIESNYNDNPWFPDELRGDMERDLKRDPDKHAHVWGGQYKSLSEARVFRNFRVGELNPPDNAVWFYGCDWGFSVDPNAALRFCIIGEDVLYIDDEVYEVGTPTERLPELLGQLKGATDWPMRADSARPETIDYVRRHGFKKLRAARKGKGSVEDGVMFLQGMDIVVHPDCVNTLRELRNYAYKTDKHTNEVLPAIEDKNNHLIDALRYAAEGLHRRGKRIKPNDPMPRKRRDAYAIDDDSGELSWKVA